MSNEEKISPRESLRMKMLAAGPHQTFEVTAEELGYILNNDINELIREVELIYEGNKVHEATERGLAAMAGGEAHADHLHQVQDQTSPVAPTFEEVVRPVMKWLAENCCPHHKIIIDSTNAELVQGHTGFVTVDYIKD